MNEPVLADTVALILVRQLAGAPGYPFHEEGEMRIAHVLQECAKSVKHAQSIIEEFETTFPTIEQIRAAARRLGEKCVCGMRRHEHVPGGRGCKRFEAPDEYAPTVTDRQNADAWKKFKQSIPEIPGVRWEVCLQIQCIRIDLGLCGSPPDHNELAKDERDFPEAVAALRAGRTPDYKLVEAVLAKRIPGWPRTPEKDSKRMSSAAERLNSTLGAVQYEPKPEEEPEEEQ